MWTYNAPLRDMHLVIEEALQAPTAWAQTPVFKDLDADTSRGLNRTLRCAMAAA